jgi:hypothetical protein
MDERIQLAESYYATAQSLEAQGRHLLDTAAMISRMADQMCEENIRQHKQAGADDANGS